MVQVWSSSGSIKMTMIITTRMLLIHLIIIMITRIQLGIECVRGPRKFQLMITTVTRMLGARVILLKMMMMMIAAVSIEARSRGSNFMAVWEKCKM